MRGTQNHIFTHHDLQHDNGSTPSIAYTKGARMATLPAHEVRKRLNTMPKWKKGKSQISRTFTFSGFQDCFAFVNAVAQRSIAADHHPDIDIRFNTAKLYLSTHDEGGLTEMDFRLAAEIDELPSGSR